VRICDSFRAIAGFSVDTDHKKSSSAGKEETTPKIKWYTFNPEGMFLDVTASSEQTSRHKRPTDATCARHDKILKKRVKQALR
jgi:hypothetical protein